MEIVLEDILKEHNWTMHNYDDIMQKVNKKVTGSIFFVYFQNNFRYSYQHGSEPLHWSVTCWYNFEYFLLYWSKSVLWIRTGFITDPDPAF
jgi:hypothetical protein